jgi:hypothetical protein
VFEHSSNAVVVFPDFLVGAACDCFISPVSAHALPCQFHALPIGAGLKGTKKMNGHRSATSEINFKTGLFWGNIDHCLDDFFIYISDDEIAFFSVLASEG